MLYNDKYTYLCKENVLKTKKYKSKLINAVHWGA